MNDLEVLVTVRRDCETRYFVHPRKAGRQGDDVVALRVKRTHELGYRVNCGRGEKSISWLDFSCHAIKLHACWQVG